MVGDAEVLESQIDRGTGHLKQRVLPVTRRGVAVEGATEIAPLDEVREFPRLGSSDLPLVLAEFGRNKIEIERLVEPLLIANFGWLFSSLGNREAIFVKRPTPVQRPAAKADIVLLATGEIDKREGKFVGLNDTQIALDAVLEANTRFCRAMDDHLLHEGMMDEKIRDLLGAIRGDQDVEITDRLLASAEASSLANLTNRLMGAQVGDELLSQHGHHIDPEAPCMLSVILYSFQQLRLGLFAKTGQLSRLPLLANTLQILHG